MRTGASGGTGSLRLRDKKWCAPTRLPSEA
ncbi:Uncharacterised protein [Mycobacteroides abscessus subsp. abscessus]|nr:Uncharacterised protein [Mycobacteroides abscessus subsp. abscessus]